MLTLKTAVSHDIYKTCIKSILKYEPTFYCFMSNDSKKSPEKMLNPMKEKKTSNNKSKRLEMVKAKHLFKLLGKSDEVKESGQPATVEQSDSQDLNTKIQDLIQVAEVVPQDSAVDLKVEKTQKSLRKRSEDINNEKVEFLKKAKEVALSLGVDVSQTQTELLKAFQSTNEHIDESSQVHQKVNQYLDKKKQEHSLIRSKNWGRYSSFRGSEDAALNIFKKTEECPVSVTEPTLQTWKYLKKVTLLHSSYHPARNYFEELVNWTQQGKLWHFPIDNEQGWSEEIATDFTEHIFLDKHLEPWCPKSGPIRHFMELVLTGLAKNPHLSANKKKDHILWYRDYFLSKSKLLTELGAMDPQMKNDIEKSQDAAN